MDYGFLLDLALILLSTKVLGLITRRFHMPQVVGALLAGLILGPALLGWLKETTYISDSAEIGVVVLMFCAGIETDVHELKKAGKASFVIALLGVITPLLGGFAIAYIYNNINGIESDATSPILLQNIFIGIVLTATSVSITVETLKELGKLNTAAGNAILGAAVIDDFLGIIALTIITSVADPRVNIYIVLAKIVGFFIFAAIFGYLFHLFYLEMSRHTDRARKRHAITAFVFCLLMSYASERFFGVADITGAYIAGLVVSVSSLKKYLSFRFDILSSLYLSPIFFASIGIQVTLPQMNSSIVIFAIILTIIAILSKVIGCGLGAKLMKYSSKESLQIGVGMISRGEVALIVASKGASLGLVSSQLISPIIIVVVITTIITPILLKPVFSNKSPTDDFSSSNTDLSY